MTAARTVMWGGRLFALLVAVLLIADAASDDNLSVWSRVLVMGVAALVFCWVTVKQGMVAYRYEGWPLTREWPFRWVVTLWFGSIALLLCWFLFAVIFPARFSTVWSTVMWLQFAESTLYFFGRWLAVGRPQLAGPGETGASGSS